MATKRAIDKELDAVLATLPVKQAKFALAYAESGIAVRSAVSAGYSDRSARARGSEMTSNVLVMRAVDLLRKRFADTAVWDAEDKLVKLQGIAESTADKDSDSYQPQVAVQSIREHNRMLGHHAAVTVNHNSTTVNISYDLKMPARNVIDIKPEEVEDN